MNTKKVGSRRYFLTYLLPTSYTDSELNAFKEEIAKLVTKHKGTVVSSDEWGKRKTAYKIRHAGKWFTDAVYVHLVLEIDPAQINLLEKDVFLNANIMRHLIVLEAGNEPSGKIQPPLEKPERDYEKRDYEKRDYDKRDKNHS